MCSWRPYLPTLRLYRESLRLGKVFPATVKRKLGYNARELIEIYRLVEKDKADELIKKGWEDVEFVNSLTSQKEEITRLLFSDITEGKKRRGEEDEEDDFLAETSKRMNRNRNIQPHIDTAEPQQNTKNIPPTQPFKRYYSQNANVQKITDNERKLLSLSLEDALLSLKKREITSTQVTQACIKQLERTKFLNYMISQRNDDALEDSKKADESYQRNQGM
eukprot:TRINITY_DN4785_c0_g3_i2.p1 TRINITY_DN4785_c0_g3~~TRINITY_DN4785_c0_g3_i2.p1  ORF type:complete len:220 (+),score=42.99 TRINITY_DN4785_c0_g3_i2:83-742(+)